MRNDMKRLLTLFLVCVFVAMEPSKAQGIDSKASEGRLRTRWAEVLDSKNVLGEYPRPILERKRWMNLNGAWDYAIVSRGSERPVLFDGHILVPFPVESQLSGVGRQVGTKQELWYRRTFSVPSSWRKDDVLLHFGAVDWQAEVWVNGQRACLHEGGFTPFTINVTPYLQRGKDQELVVRVWDPTNEGPQPRGKQDIVPHTIWYSSVTGIWQTVWLEPVSPIHISRLICKSDIAAPSLTLTADVAQADEELELVAVVKDDGRTVASARGKAGKSLVVNAC